MPSVGAVCRLADALGCPVGALFTVADADWA
jgi:hypothetical protein